MMLFPCIQGVVPGRREAANPEPMTTNAEDRDFRVRVLRRRPGMAPLKLVTQDY
jgi:hypothetical protein